MKPKFAFFAFLLVTNANAEWLEIKDQFETIDATHYSGVWQNDDGTLKPKMWNPSLTDRFGRKLHPHGQPNAHSPWLNPGGVVGQPADFSRRIFYKIPKGQKIELFNDRWNNFPGWTPRTATRQAWKFPKGTIAEVHLYDGKRHFSTHRSTKTGSGVGISEWDGEETYLSRPPSWYNTPTDCVSCHEDIGKQGFTLRNERNYYGWLRGSDGRFSWHPFKTK